MSTEQSSVTYRDVPGFPGYRVGDDGSVWSCCLDPSRWYPLTLRPISKRVPYLRVTLCRGGRTHTKVVHTLVLEAFRGPCPDGMECRHLNGKEVDNRLENLAWGTPLQNADDKRRHGTMAHNRGERCGASKLTDDEVLGIRKLYATGCYTYEELALSFGVSKPTVCLVVRRKVWQHV